MKVGEGCKRWEGEAAHCDRPHPSGGCSGGEGGGMEKMGPGRCGVRLVEKWERA